MDTNAIILIVLQVLALALAGVGLYGFIRVFLAMRENGEQVVATLCLVTLLLMGIGGLVAFVYGIIKSRDWELERPMMLWGTCHALSLVIVGAIQALPMG